jgi:hypothetical protein
VTELASLDRRLAVQAALVQLAAVAVVFAVLALSLPHSFFEDWGVLVGPAAWVGCSAATARILGLSLTATLAAAAAAGVLGALAGLAIGHTPGIVVAIGLFGLLAGARLRRSRG